MDSINLSETQSTPLNYRSTASNTSPGPCACCGLKNHAQTIPQAYYFRALYPGLPKCKHCQGNAEEKFPVQQQFFAGLPSFLPPFFCNNAIPTNSCCSHHLNEASANEQQKQQPTERDKIPLFANHYFCQKEKCGLRMNNTAADEVKKNNSIYGPEEQFLGHPFFISHSPDIQLNSFFHRCGCGDSITRPCSPFILPVISYCVLWNSQKSSLGILPGNYSEISPETFCPKNNENPENQKHSGTEGEKEIFSKNSSKDFNNNSTETADYEEEECLRAVTITRNEWEKETELDVDQNSSDSLRPPASNSSNSSRENSFKNVEQINGNSSVKGSEVHLGKEEENEVEEEEEDMEAYDSAAHDRSEECLALGEKNLPNLRANLYLSNDSQGASLNENESQSSSVSQSMTDLKETRKSDGSATEFSSSDMEANPSEISAEEKFSDNECERKIPEMKATYFKTPISIKKFIKNFTMTDHTNSVHEEVQNSAAAAGDLGGENCVGYKVNILKTFEEDQQYKILQETQTEENFQSKAFFIKGLSDMEDHQPESYSEKNTIKNSKGPRSFRSGIAKLSNNSKLKELKGDAVKKVTNLNKELSQKVPTVIKRKHNCFPDSSAGINDIGSKIQKTRNGMVQQQSQGSEKQNRTTYGRNQPPRRGEKILKVKTQADKSNFQKFSKATKKN